jgi:hypothetical protein
MALPQMGQAGLPDIFTTPLNFPAPHPATATTSGGGGMFGHGKVQIDLGRALAGFAAGMGNQGGVQALQALNEMRRQQLEHQQALDDYNRKRTDDNADFVTHLQQKAQYEPAPTDEYTRALVASGIQPGTPEFARHMAARAAILENPPRYEMVNGALVQVGGPSIQQGPPPAPVGTLKPYNPGGPTPGASGGFPGH